MNRLKVYLKTFIKIMVRVLSRILFIFPLKQNQIMFSVFWGEKVTDNPKCVYNYLRENYPNKFRYVWVYNKDTLNIDLEPEVKIVKRFSLSWFYYRLTSKVVVDNCNPSYAVPKRKKQAVVETWHAGGAYKKVGSAAAQYRIEQYTLDKAMELVDLFVSSSYGFTRGNIEEGYHYSGEILECGMPRNDIFFDKSMVKNARVRVQQNYALEGLIVLYAPTFRGDLSDADEMRSILDAEKLQEVLERRYATEVNILVRCHHWDRHKYRFGENVIDVADYPDMQELLCASDILITDYSSSMWDYALLGRPCLLYVPDINEYIENRGFFTPIEQWPGIVCKDMSELCKAVENLNENECVEIAKRHLELMGSYETGHATEMVCNRVLDYIRKEKT